MSVLYPSTSYRELTSYVNKKLAMALGVTLIIKYMGVFATYNSLIASSLINFVYRVGNINLNKYIAKGAVIGLLFCLSFI